MSSFSWVNSSIIVYNNGVLYGCKEYGKKKKKKKNKDWIKNRSKTQEQEHKARAGTGTGTGTWGQCVVLRVYLQVLSAFDTGHRRLCVAFQFADLEQEVVLQIHGQVLDLLQLALLLLLVHGVVVCAECFHGT
jgi:hypothetical protein